jgi:hypothetical protein
MVKKYVLVSLKSISIKNYTEDYREGTEEHGGGVRKFLNLFLQKNTRIPDIQF